MQQFNWQPRGGLLRLSDLGHPGDRLRPPLFQLRERARRRILLCRRPRGEEASGLLRPRSACDPSSGQRQRFDILRKRTEKKKKKKLFCGKE